MIKINLYEAEKGNKYKIVSVDGGYKVTQRLAELGIFKGVIVEKVEMITYGPIKIKVRGSTYALGRGITKKIIVEEK